MSEQRDRMAIARQRIAEEAERRTGSLDLSNLELEALPEELFELRHLRELTLAPWWREAVLLVHAQRKRLSSLIALERLSVERTDLASLDFVADLPRLTQLECWGTRVNDLAPLAVLTQLQVGFAIE